MSRPLFGVGLREVHLSELCARPEVCELYEIITENVCFARGAKRERLRWLAERANMGLHGLSLNVCGHAELDEGFLRELRALADELGALYVSDHLSWTRHGARSTYDLLPTPFTEAALDHTAARVQHVQERLGRPLVLENVSTYVRFASDELSEAQFTRALLERTGARLLLDVNNLYVNATNHGFDAAEFLRQLPDESVAAVHVAGHERRATFCFDTHDRPVSEEVWALYRAAMRRFSAASTVVEWDSAIPPLSTLLAEVARARVEAQQ